jgi:sugar phosphate permease
MSFKKASVAAVIAVSMASTPVLAQTATSAAPLSVAARSGAAVSDEASDLRGGFIIPLVAIVAVILGILAATSGSDRPHSP